MDRSADIQFLQEYRDAVATYLGEHGVPFPNLSAYANVVRETKLGANQAEQVRRRIAEGRGRAQNLLQEFGRKYQYADGSTRKIYRLLDLVTDNPVQQHFSTALFTDQLDEAVGLLKAGNTPHTAAVADSTVVDEPTEFDYAVSTLEQFARRFPLVVEQLRHRHGGRTAFVMQDEYDVQDLFGAILQLEFDDIRREEATPSLAGSSSRIDFLLQDVGIAIEIKMTRPGLDARKLKTELSEDFLQYPRHPEYKGLVVFVYDPAKLISNPTGFEKDLSKPLNGMPIYVFVVQG